MLSLLKMTRQKIDIFVNVNEKMYLITTLEKIFFKDRGVVKFTILRGAIIEFDKNNFIFRF